MSYVTRTDGFDCGVMISASHNPYHDNGIKLMNREGEKMDEATIRLVEDYLDGNLSVDGQTFPKLPFATGEGVGSIVDHTAGRNRYMGYLISLAVYSFRGKKIALDCANGSAWSIAPNVFRSLGADVHIINDRPDGLNINLDAGSTHIEGLKKYVKEQGCDAGFAFDGDADRCLAVDENGNLVDGDQIMYLYGAYMKERGKLLTNAVVTTVMSNFGLYKALDRAGIGYNFFYLTGIAGAGQGERSAKASAEVFNRLHPRLIGSSMLTVYPDSRLYQEIQAGNWTEAGEVEKYEELKTLVSHLTIPVTFAALGASNAFNFQGKLPEDRERLAGSLKELIETADEGMLRDYRVNLRHL